MIKYKISAVSYLNTLPFLYGIENSSDFKKNIDISLDYPSICADKLINNEVDIGLIPVAVIPKIQNANIISDYCIGANGKVKSVLLLTDKPISEIKNIYLDYQSRTSVELLKILAKKYWKISPNWISAEKEYEKKISGNTAGLVIGDRALEIEKKYKYSYDLAYEWKKYTNLPFVFATWTANKDISQTFINDLNEILKIGIENIDDVINYYKNYINTINNGLDIKEYLTKNISYNFDEQKKIALNKFLKK